MDVPFMFHMHSPYSPFFTSGLLSARAPDVPTSPRRGSLPTDNVSPRDEDVSAFYFTLQPRRDEDEFRSFLSLDLAESQSMRSASLKRKASASTSARAARSTRTLSKPNERLFRFPRIPEVPVPSPVSVSAPTPTSLRMRFSRDSLRTIPSPKPAPSITLPELPKVAQSPPRLPSIQLTPSLELSFPAPPHAPARDVARLRLNLNNLHNTSTKANHRVSVATKASSSTVSTRARRHNRSEALACLEGRSRPATAPLPSHTRRPLPTIPIAPSSASTSSAKRNFMSMSDDDETSDEDDDSDADGDNIEDDLSDLDSFDFPDVALLDPHLEPEDVVLPTLLAPSPGFLEAPRSAPLPPRTPHSPFLAPPNPNAQHRRPAIGRASTADAVMFSAPPAKDWFPLKSFIDLHAPESHGIGAPSLTPTTSASGGSSVEKGARAEGRKRVYGAQTQKGERKGSESRSSGSGGGKWMWRSFIEVANVS